MHGGRLNTPCWAASAVAEVFCRVGNLTFGSVVNIAGPELDNPAAQAAGLGVRFVQIISKLLEYLKRCLTGHKCLLLNEHSDGLIVPHTGDPFPCFGIHHSSLTVQVLFKMRKVVLV